jgi:hypothetical protein
MVRAVRGNERDRGRLVALAEDAQGAVTAFEAKILDVAGAGFADPQPVEPEQHGERRVVAVVLVGGEQEHAELGTVQPPGIGGVHPRAADILGRVRPDPPVDVREPLEATDRRESSVDR